MKKLILSIILAISIIVLSATGPAVTLAVPKSPQISAPINLQVSRTSANNYTIQVGANSIPIGQATASFTPKMSFPSWQGYAWNAQLDLTMAVTGNALAAAGMTSSSTSTSVTASNTYFSITYSGTAVKPGFNETGGLDMNITIKKNIGTALAFGYNSTNVTAYVQPPLTSEWTVGQTLPDGNTVASVTATTVTDNLGTVRVNRPSYIVGSIVLYNSKSTGYVTPTQSASGYTDGQIGILYAPTVTGANGVKSQAAWSISGSNFILSFSTTGMTYPIQITPPGDTLGYITQGGTTTNISTNHIMGAYPCTPTYNGVLYSISVYTYSSVLNGGIAGMYTKASSAASLLAVTYPYASPASYNWVTANVVGGVSVTASTDYILAFITNGSSEYYAYNSISSYYIAYYSTTYNGSLPASVTWSNYTWSSNTRMSIYATYTTYATANSPSANTGSAWTNPTYAYSGNNTNATMSSGNPSGSNIFGNYGFSIASANTITGVTVGDNAWSAGVNLTPTIRNVGATAYGTTSLTLNQPTSTATNDVLVAFVNDGASTGSSAVPTGWTKIGGWTNNYRMQIYTAVVGANSLSGTSWTWTGLSSICIGAIIGFYNVDYTGFGYLDSVISSRANSTGTYGTTSITTNDNNAMVIAVFGVTNNASTWSAESCATLGALAENIDYTRSSILSFAVASAVQATAGATGASTATPSVAGGNNGVLFSLAPIRQYTSAVKLSVSWDGGTSWSSAQTTSLTGTYIASTDNFTGAVSWTPAMLNDGTFQVKALTQTGTSVETVNLDWLPVVVTYTVPPSITDSPSSIDIGLVKPGQTYYASGSAYSNPVTAGQCTFTVTNTGSAPCGISLQCSNATGGNSWLLVSSTPTGDQFKVIAVYAGEDPASGLVLTTSPQTFDASLATSGTLQWDFMEIMGGLGGAHGTFSDANQKTFSLTLVAY